MPIPVEPSIENQPVIIDDPSREPWAGLNPCLQPGLNGELINVCEIQDNEKKKKEEEERCKVVPYDFGTLTREQYLTANNYPKYYYPEPKIWGQSHNCVISIDERGYKYLWLTEQKIKLYFVKCHTKTKFSSSYRFYAWDGSNGFSSSSGACLTVFVDEGYLHLQIYDTYYHLSEVHPGGEIEEKDINEEIGTTGTTGGNSTTGTTDTVGGLQGRGGKDDDKKQLVNGQNWYMFLIPILLWFYKKKND